MIMLPDIFRVGLLLREELWNRYPLLFVTRVRKVHREIRLAKTWPFHGILKGNSWQNNGGDWLNVSSRLGSSLTQRKCKFCSRVPLGMRAEQVKSTLKRSLICCSFHSKKSLTQNSRCLTCFVIIIVLETKAKHEICMTKSVRVDKLCHFWIWEKMQRKKRKNKKNKKNDERWKNERRKSTKHYRSLSSYHVCRQTYLFISFGHKIRSEVSV